MLFLATSYQYIDAFAANVWGSPGQAHAWVLTGYIVSLCVIARAQPRTVSLHSGKDVVLITVAHRSTGRPQGRRS